jgi:hypothetical protein
MRLREKLDEITEFVVAARGLPVSSSVIVNKAELTRLLEELRELLPEDLIEAQAVLDRRDEILTEAVSNAERLLTAAGEEQRRLVSEAEVVQEARVEAGALIQGAHDQAAQMARDIDAYVDAKLAHLEVSVTKLLEAVRQGRERLAQPELYSELGDLPEPVGQLDSGEIPRDVPAREQGEDDQPPRGLHRRWASAELLAAERAGHPTSDQPGDETGDEPGARQDDAGALLDEPSAAADEPADESVADDDHEPAAEDANEPVQAKQPAKRR